MVSTSSISVAAAALAVAVQHVDAHGYMYIPLAEFDGTATSSWIVQISPQWSGDWDSCSSDDSDCLTSVYTALKSSNGYSDIRTLLDSDTSLYGADCGYTDRTSLRRTPQRLETPPYGDGTQETASVFTPVDYSSCSTSGCMLRFYWLAFQGVDSEIVWQVYKDCVPLTGPASGSSTSTTTTSSTTSETTTENEADATASTSTASTSESTATPTTTPSATTSESTTTDSGNSWTSGSKTQGNGNQGGNGWSGGFGGMGGGLRK
ncbi:hypothetical protein PHYSODRAFT_324755 [Phytophthora sojae]|uniref:Uncharacterized protein n=1 Tax=Phytophthora sojae (strain P6497) TaxID=1094619 RepID=G4YTG4_PHYSP|nr:hypothetical protein PHYSODRAFT_324755 [Phytophthora sojae]EGZ23563.1 hypothetical protein PHYSODRAFT_324755 [Phytophthora sojae]|eukprot:XP_009518851.1 hypothetical protein PHYSODRAFT_324755 [Phytophthora sojae]